MRLFDKMTEPVFLKETSNAETELQALEELLKIENIDKDVIMQKIKIIRYGIAGEKTISFELKNSHLPMFILHDIYLESDSLSAQIDYIIFTPWRFYVIECKTLIGDIEINNNGDFIRTLDYNGRKKREGIYSPITQNKRHIDLIKGMAMKDCNALFRKRQEKILDDTYKSVIVLANPKTILNARYAPKEVKQQVIRADGLIDYIKTDRKNCKDSMSIKAVKEVAESFLAAHKEKPMQDFSSLIRPIKENVEKDDIIVEPIQENTDLQKLEAKLKKFRLEQSRLEHIKPYFIYNNMQMQQLIEVRPKNIDELAKISGFGEIKCKKYGEQILEIINS